MAKYFIIIIFVLLSLLLGCSSQNERERAMADNDDIRLDQYDSGKTKQDYKSSLSDIEETFSHLDYKSVIKAQSKIMPDGVSITKFRYFVIFSDMNDDLTYRLIDTDIRNTIDAMTGNYVNKLPDRVTPIYLFENYDDYKEFVLDNYDIPEDDISPYGFFKISKNVIVIRYVSWKGSILHEVTHRFIKADFPDAPSWFDEGFAAMNEKSTFKNGNLIADYSMRMLALQRALKENTYTNLEHLMKTDDEELYGKRTSFFYAQSRYLLMYLQQQGLLDEYYRKFRDTYHDDKTGITQLEAVTGKPVAELEEIYLEYINSLKQQ